MYRNLPVVLTAIFAALLLVYWFVDRRKRKNRIVRLRETSLTCEELEAHARKIAIEHAVSKRKSLSNWPLFRMNENYQYILSTYKDLNEDVKRKKNIPQSAEWLLDNFYIVEEQVKTVRKELRKEDYLRLPVLKCGILKGNARILAVAMELVAHADGQMNDQIILNFLKAYQTHSYLQDRELWIMPVMVRIALIEHIRQICERIHELRIHWRAADEIADSWAAQEGVEPDGILKMFKARLKNRDELSPAFVEHLLYRLRRSGKSYVQLLKTIDENLDKFGTSSSEITGREHNTQAANAVSMGNYIMSLKFISAMDWLDVFEAVSFVEEILRQDPRDVYAGMDMDSRSHYRGVVEKIADRYGFSELHVAKEAVLLAKNVYSSSDATVETEELLHTYHVGFYLLGKGLPALEQQLGVQKSPVQKLQNWAVRHTALLYFGSIFFLFFCAEIIALLLTVRFKADTGVPLLLLAAVAVSLPVSEIVMNVVNWLSCKIRKPAFFPRLELKQGIPESCSAFVVIPSVITDEKRVDELLENLERHYLSNPESSLYFALLADFKDCSQRNPKDEQVLIQRGLKGIEVLNDRYAPEDRQIFFFFCRQRMLNESHGRWMGWERKRGAISELNELLLGGMQTSFYPETLEGIRIPHVRYVLTLDADTILPMGMAKKMIGTMVHPLNTPVIDKSRGIVTEGYGLLQPRILFDITSANRTLFSQIFTGQEGIDPYACAISDVYQDLFGEGIFTGKGIYDLQVFHAVLKDVIPDNSVLSHDLLEGSHVRTGLVTGLELVDGYPSSYNSYSTRLHRWVRGDWQLLPWLRKLVPDRNGGYRSNPLSGISKWKMVDNLRRSLVPPGNLLLILLGFSVLPGSSLWWMSISLAAIGINFIIDILSFLLSGNVFKKRSRRYVWAVSGIRASLLQTLLQIIFLPYQSLILLHAIAITLERLLHSKRNMLEWVTAAEAERTQKNSLAAYRTKMSGSYGAAILLLILAMLLKKNDIPFGLVLALLWGASPYVAFRISKENRKKAAIPTEEELREIRHVARKTWRYFEEFADAKNHFLPPDNYQEDPLRGVAARTSPTNMGLGLLAILSARDFGYMGTLEMVEMLHNSMTTLERMEKWQGHLYNWYDTRNLRPLRPAYISTVDSGNLACYLIALIQGLREYREAPLVDNAMFQGVHDMLELMEDEEFQIYRALGIFLMNSAHHPIDLFNWFKVLQDCAEDHKVVGMKKNSWKTKTGRMIRQFRKELDEIMPWLNDLERQPQFIALDAPAEAGEILEKCRGMLLKNHAFGTLPDVYKKTMEDLDQLSQALEKWKHREKQRGMEWVLELMASVEKARDHAIRQLNRLDELISRVEDLFDGMKFTPLYVEKQQLFSIGYNIEENRLTNSFYDLLASEARQTSYIAIAKGEVPPKHWFKMGRALTSLDGYKGLVSWTGTMFEYLMPLLLMRSYKNTLMDETYDFVVRSQIKYGRQRNIPWGVSESGFYSLDIHLDYQYKAIGVPWLGLKRGLIEDAVVAPYATFLALSLNPKAALENLLVLKDAGMEGPYGYYEAVDYTPERIPFGAEKAIVKSFMAHHQGMSLLAMNNFLHDSIMQKRFHSHPLVSVAQLLLQEKVPQNFVFTKETKEKVVPWKGLVYKERIDLRRFNFPDGELPRVQILSNGAYSVMVTDKGTGYSKSRRTMVTRWREDNTLDESGMFFYIRHVESDTNWSSTYEPMLRKPDNYEVLFSSDKAVFRRKDGDVETETEVMVTSEETAEIRRITLKNRGKTPCTLEVTSYFEVVLASQAADVAHPTFSNLFVKTEYHPERKCLTAQRRQRSESDKGMVLAHMAMMNGIPASDIHYETDRMQFMGRGRGVSNPSVIERNRPLSDTVGPVLDPVMSIRVRMRIEPGKTASVSFLTAVSESMSLLWNIVDKYSVPESAEVAFKVALSRIRMEMGFLNRKPQEIERYQELVSHLLFLSPSRRQYAEMLSKNRKGQSSLWTYGVSGDLPILMVVLSKAEEMDLLFEAIKAHEYWRMKDVSFDLVVLSEEENSYENPLREMLSDALLFGQAQEVLNKPGGIFILDRTKIPHEDVELLYAVARIILRGSSSLAEQLRRRPVKKELPETSQGKGEDYAANPIPEEELHYFNGLGGFDPKTNEYVIRLEKGHNTPAPWVNVISNPNFGFLVSESGGGYTWCENSRENKITLWSNDPVSDTPSEVFYLHDRDSGQTWSAAPLPIREEEPYVIRHGFGYSRFRHNSHGLEQALVQFVPVSDPVKISIMTLRNTSGHIRHITVAYYIRPVLGVTDQITARHIKTYQDGEGVLMLENPYNEEFPGRFCFMDVSERQRRVCGDRKVFFGGGNRKTPVGMLDENLPEVLGVGFDPCGVVQVQLEIPAGGEKELIFLLGLGQELLQVSSITGKYRNVKNAKSALEEVKSHWEDTLGSIRVTTPQLSMNLLMNGWLVYQVMSCRVWARSGFYQSGGAYGFRDQLQDVLSFAMFRPDLVRKQILLHASHQFPEGDVQHWWHEPWGKGTRTRFSDDLLWLPYAVAEYIRISGDEGVLTEEVHFVEDEVLKEDEDERYSRPEVSSEKGTVYDHCVRAIEHALKFGSHGLPLMGSGDWNDGMSTVGNKGQGESVWLGWFLVKVLSNFAPLAERMKDADSSNRYLGIREKLLASIEENAWDGCWYRRAYFDSGIPLGSQENTECRIDSLGQTWAVLSGGGDGDRIHQAMESLENYLVQRDLGLIKLLTPPFDEGDLEPGYIKGYVPGVRENGGQYTHAAAWVIIAFAEMGEGDKAGELFDLINPVNHTRTTIEYARYKVEPYVMAADVYAIHPHEGRGGWTWYTGSAGWMYRAGLENILGIQKKGNEMAINPCIPKKWPEYSVEYRYMKTRYEIHIKNPDGVSRGVKELVLDGKTMKISRFPLENDGEKHKVEVVLGNESIQQT